MGDGSTPAAPDTVSDDPTAGKYDAILKQIGKDVFLDVNSHVLRSDGSALFRALDRKTGEQETLRVDKTGDLTLRPGWPK